VQGGSTLTQQLVKNFFLSQDRTVARKVNEALMSLLLELHYDKADILGAYLNEVFLGQQGAYAVHGFGRAAEFYFDEPLDRLQPQQIALLIGLVKGPSYYNPRRHPERALARRNLVLDVMEEQGLVEAGEAAADDHAAGVVLNLRSGETVYAEVDPGLLGRVMSVVTPAEFGAIVDAIVEAVEHPDRRGFCQRRRDESGP